MLPKRYILHSMFVLFFISATASGQTQLDMNETAYANYQKADVELNLVYKEILKVFSKKEKKLLVEAQRNWIKFRDSHCEFVAAGYEGGSIKPLIYNDCLEQTTKSRVEELKIILTDLTSK